nr:MAG TPA: hypothetical protein [Caudoviricetes sp.]
MAAEPPNLVFGSTEQTAPSRDGLPPATQKGTDWK